jgi:hypothetical protein
LRHLRLLPAVLQSHYRALQATYPEARSPKPHTLKPKPEQPFLKIIIEHPRQHIPKPESQNPCPETPNPKPETRNTEHGTRTADPEARHLKRGIRTPKSEQIFYRVIIVDSRQVIPNPETRNLTPETRHPEPELIEPFFQVFIEHSRQHSIHSGSPTPVDWIRQGVHQENLIRAFLQSRYRALEASLQHRSPPTLKLIREFPGTTCSRFSCRPGAKPARPHSGLRRDLE